MLINRMTPSEKKASALVDFLKIFVSNFLLVTFVFIIWLNVAALNASDIEQIT